MNPLSQLLQTIKTYIVFPSEDNGYIVVFYTGLHPTVRDKLTGEVKDILMYDVIGPMKDPEKQVVGIANILDSYNLPAYNIQVVKGVFSESKFNIMPDFDSFKATTHDRVTKWKLSRNLNDALGL